MAEKLRMYERKEVAQGRRIAHHQDPPQVRCSAEYMDTSCRCYFPRNGRAWLDISK